MRWTSTCFVVAIAAIAGGCGAGETRVDPGDLELHDLLGVAPEVAMAWDADQRASARRVLATALDDESIDALGGAIKPTAELVLANDWDGHTWSGLAGRGTSLLSTLAMDSGHRAGRVVIVPGPRAPSISTYEDNRLVVNPVVLAAIEPSTNELATAQQLDRVVPAVTTSRVAAPNAYQPVTPEAVAASGNPYSFYGSVAECAFAQRARCESCVTNNSCDPVTNSDGTAECNRLAEDNGRGYYLICVNLALAISSVENCALEKASGCARDTDAADSLAELENNARFLDDAACAAPLDACLGEIYGAPPEDFPGLDGGIVPPREPRNTTIDCGDSCSSSNNNCEADPSCDCSGPSCNNSFSCDSTCANSNSGNTNCGNCDSCDSSSGGGGGGGGGGGCDSSSSSSGGDCGGNNNCSGGDCGGGCEGGGCSGGDGCNNSGGGGCNSGGGGGSCNVAKRQSSSGGFALWFSLGFAFAPLPAAMIVLRRARRRTRRTSASIGVKGEEVAS